MPEIKQTKRAGKILQQAMQYCREYRHEFVMPEHLLLAMTDNYNFNHTLNIFNPSSSLAEQLEDQLEEIEMMPENKAYEPEASAQMAEVIETPDKIQIVLSDIPTEGRFAYGGYGYGYGYGYGGYGYGYGGYGYGGYGYGKRRKSRFTKRQNDAAKQYYYYHDDEEEEDEYQENSTTTQN